MNASTPEPTSKNATPCGGENNVYDGCGMVFDRMPLDSKLCNLCVKLKGASSVEEADQLRVRRSICC